jgi:hypothetical protein
MPFQNKIIFIFQLTSMSNYDDSVLLSYRKPGKIKGGYREVDTHLYLIQDTIKSKTQGENFL